MKRYRIIVLLVLLLIPFTSVKASIVLKTSKPNANNSIYKGVVYYSNEPEASGLRLVHSPTTGQNYYVHYIATVPYRATLAGKRVELTCVDPGLSLTGDPNDKQGNTGYVTCDPIDNAKIENIYKTAAMKTSMDHAVRDLAIRYAVAQLGASYTKGLYGMKALQGGWGNLSEVSNNPKADWNSSYAPGTHFGPYITAAQKLYNSAPATSTKTETSSSSELLNVKFDGQFVSNYNGKVTANVSTQSGVALNATPTFICTSGCSENTPVQVNWTPGSNHGQIVFSLEPSGECNPVFTISYSAANGSLYKCFMSDFSGNIVYYEGQTFLAYIPDDVLAYAMKVDSGKSATGLDNSLASKSEFKVIIPDNVKKEVCGNVCDEPCNVSNTVESHVQLCCSETTGSEVREPNIDDIFCDLKGCFIKKDGKLNDAQDSAILVSRAYDGKSGKYSTDEEINEYCATYCTERVKVLLPGANNGRNGKYFQLKSIHTDSGKDSYGPYIKGNLSCRNIIYYNKWLKEYVETTQEATRLFNDYQHNINSYYSYLDTYNKYPNSGEDTLDQRSFTYSGGCMTDCGWVSCSADTDYCTPKFKYERHLQSAEGPYSYGKVKIEYKNNIDYINGFNGLKIVSDTNGTGATSITGYYGVEFEEDCSSYVGKQKGASSCGDAQCYKWDSTLKKYVDNGTASCPNYPTLTAQGSKATLRDIKTDFNNAKNSYESNAKDKQASYKVAMEKLSDLKEKLEECDNYYIDGEGSTDAYIKSKINYGSISFEWFIAYVNFQSIIDADVHTIPLESECDYNVSGEWTYDSSDSSIGAPKAPKYNQVGPHYASIQNFDRSKTVDCISNRPEGCSNKVPDFVEGAPTDYNQKYTSDAVFRYDCAYKTPNLTTKFTVYPYGGYTEDSESNPLKWAYTKHDGREYIEHSAIYGTYQTKWSGLSIGSNGKFDEYFASGTTCAKESNQDGVNLYCTLEVTSDLVKINGCPTELDDPVISNEDGSSKNWSNICCDGPCGTTVDDALTYTFKIVDPINLFPGSKRNEDNKYVYASSPVGKDKNGNDVPYAYNWFGVNRGTGALKEIEDNSKNDELYDPSRITYEFELSSKALKAIKDYNSYVNNYNDLKYGSYTETSSLVKKYHSNFIDNYYKTGVLKADHKEFNLGITTLGDSALTNGRKKVHWDCYGEATTGRCEYISKNN